MDDTTIRPEAVDAASNWLADRREIYTREALTEQLRVSGYTAAEIQAGWARLDEGKPLGRASEVVAEGADLRPKAALIALLGFFATWAVMSLILVQPSDNYTDYGSLAAFILGAVLLPIALLTLLGIANSGRLRRGAEGALVAILTLPFVILVIVAGLCVATTNGLQV